MNELLKNVYERVIGRRREILMIVSALRRGSTSFWRAPWDVQIDHPAGHLGMQGPPVLSGDGNSDLTTSKLIGYFDPAETLAKGYRPESFSTARSCRP